ncbi:MAG: YqhA family protein [Burkholderiaceae bacterium]
MAKSSIESANARPVPVVPRLIFATRWLQLPLYVGLILAQAVYVYHFWVELVHLVEAALGNKDALAMLVKSIGYQLPEIRDATGALIGHEPPAFNETVIMLVVLALIDVVMISNLLIMVIVGGYETFVSRMYLEGHPDQPEWLSHVNASVLKVKLATAIIGISSIHLLKTFINAQNYSEKVLIAQTAIHITFLLSAMAVAVTDRLMLAPTRLHRDKDREADADAH